MDAGTAALGLGGGLALGLSLAAPPGPVNAVIATVAAERGWAAGVRAGLAAPIVDTLYMLLLAFGLHQVLDLAAVERPAAAVGAVLMSYFAYATVRSPPPRAAGAVAVPGRGMPDASAAGSASPRGRTPAASPGHAPVAGTFWAVFALSAANPYQIAWWASGGTILVAGQGAWGVAGFLAAIFSWVLVFAWAVGHGAQRWAWFTPAVVVVSADVLAAYAVVLGFAAATGL